MHPRGWGWLTQVLDTTNRPLVVPRADGPFNAQGILERVDSQQVVEQIQGVPVVTDANLATNLGAGSNQDFIYVMRASDIVLFESGFRARALYEPLRPTCRCCCRSMAIWPWLFGTRSRLSGFRA
jgi:hypothetical protein